MGFRYHYANVTAMSDKAAQLLIDFDDLVELTGYSQGAALRECLLRNGIRIIEGKDGRFAVLASDLAPVAATTWAGR